MASAYEQHAAVFSELKSLWGKNGDIADHVRAHITGFLLYEENVSGVCTGKTCVVAYWPKLKSPPPSLYGILAPTYVSVHPEPI